MQCFIHVKVNFREKNQIPPFEKFPFLVLARNVILLPHLSILCSIICQLVAYCRLKTKENFKLLAIKVVVGAYERWLLTRDSNYSDSTCKLLVFWKTGCWFTDKYVYLPFVTSSLTNTNTQLSGPVTWWISSGFQSSSAS